MTNLEILELFGEARSNYIVEAHDLRSRTSERKRMPMRKLWLLAAAVITTLALSLTAYAAINARIRMQMTHTAETPAEEKAALCTVYPQLVPDGYRLISGSTNSADVRELYYWKDSGTEIVFTLSIRQDLREIPLDPAGQKTAITVSGIPAILYQMESNRLILWKNEEDGYTATLRTNDPAVDLPAMAESVSTGETMPENFSLNLSGETNGLWYPQQLPEGYALQEVSPAAEGTQSITYARRYEDGSADYIQYVVSLTRDLSDIGQAPHSTMVWEDVDISGAPGRMVTIGEHQKILFWKNEVQDFNAMLMTEAMGEDLIAIAASVADGEKLEISPMYTHEPEYSVRMEQSGDYVAFEPWYPQAVPEGYEINFVSDKAYGEQTVRYVNAQGEAIQYVLHYRMGGFPRGYEGDTAPKEVDINGIPGYLIENEQAKQLLWVNEEKGFGFVLSTGADVDILTMARSVAPAPELPATNAGKTAEALAQLGDYRITALPEGMEEDGVSGWPAAGDEDWYGYVRRWYFGHTDNRRISMEYSTYVVDPQHPATMQETASMIAGTDSRPVQIGNNIGAVSEYEGHTTLVWLIGDDTQGISFHLYSDHFTGEELIAIAESIRQVG